MTDSIAKKMPTRMCVACRQQFPKRELIRVVRTPDGAVCIDLSGKANGRGAYVCHRAECAVKCAKGLLRKHLDCDIPPEIIEELKKIGDASTKE